jgi:hypothetical protein
MVGAAFAEPFVECTPQKGAWKVTTVKVDPSHIDDYLTGLKRGWGGRALIPPNAPIVSFFELDALGDGRVTLRPDIRPPRRRVRSVQPR